MKIVKLENGNVEIRNDAGEVQEVFAGGCCLYMQLKCDESIVQIVTSGGKYVNIDCSEVTATQVLPAAEVPFAGDCSALLTLLSSSFFFEVSGGGGGLLQYNKATGIYQSFLETAATIISYANAIAPNLLLGFPIWVKSEVDIQKLKVKITNPVAGNSVWGLYSTANGLPSDLLFQTTAINNNVAGAAVYTLPTPETIAPGLYYVVYNSNSAVGLAFNCAEAKSVISIIGGDVSDVPAALLGRAFAYTGTLPATFGTPTSYYSTASVTHVPLVQFEINY